MTKIGWQTPINLCCQPITLLVFIPSNNCCKEREVMHWVEVLNIRIEHMSKWVISQFQILDLMKVKFKKTLMKTITMQSFTNLNHSKTWWLKIMLDPSFSHSLLVGLQSKGGSMATTHWFCMVNFKKENYWSKIVGSKNGPTNIFEIWPCALEK